MSKKFNFHIPAEIFKSEEEDVWRVRGIASTPDQDLQGELVDQEGLDISPLKAGKGLFNWDHQKGPENILGQIEEADFVDVEGKKCLMVDGYLFKNQERAKAFYNILTSMKKGNAPRIHMSIEGKILGRDPMNPKAIKKARIDKVALTMDPVNPYTYAELVKSLTAKDDEQEEQEFTISKSDLRDIVQTALEKAGLYFKEGKLQDNPKPELQEDSRVEPKELEMVDNTKLADDMRKQMADLQAQILKAEGIIKALAAGTGSANAPGDQTGGAAMTKESLESDVKVMEETKKRRKVAKPSKTMVKSLVSSLKKAHPDEDPLQLAEWVIEMFLEKAYLDNKEGESQ